MHRANNFLLIKSIVRGGLVDRQSHLLKSGHLQDVFAQVVVQVVEGEVGHHL
jgi:hypothetical protein